MTAKALVNRAPPPIPCRPRKAISWIMPPPNSGPKAPASPQSQEPATKISTPAIRTRFRPHWSPSLPQIGTITVEDSR
jgi:hypothetical protein